VNADFMSGHVLINEHGRAFDDTGPNNVESRIHILFFEFLQQYTKISVSVQ